VGSGAPETSQNGGGGYGRSATGQAQWPIGPQMMGRGITATPPPSDVAGQLVDVVGGWVRETAGSGRVSGAMVHLSKYRLGT